MTEAWKAVVESVQDARSRARMKHISYTGSSAAICLLINHIGFIRDHFDKMLYPLLMMLQENQDRKLCIFQCF